MLQPPFPIGDSAHSCVSPFDSKLHLTPDYSQMNAEALRNSWRMHVNMFPALQSLVSSCCTLGRSRSEGWTSTTPTTTTSSPSLCLTSTTWPWWTTTLWSTVFTGRMSAPRPSRERSSMALELRLWFLLVRRRRHTRTHKMSNSFQFVQIFLKKERGTGNMLLIKESGGKKTRRNSTDYPWQLSIKQWKDNFPFIHFQIFTRVSFHWFFKIHFSVL